MKQMHRSHKFRTLLPLFLALMMIFCSVPVVASAEEEQPAPYYPPELLLRLNALDKDSVAYHYDAANQKLTNFYNADNYNNRTFHAGTTNKSDIQVIENTELGLQVAGGFGVSTGLNLGAVASEGWTIELYVKLDDSMVKDSGVHFFVSLRGTGESTLIPFSASNNTTTGGRVFLFQNDGKATSNIVSWNASGKSADYAGDNFWKENVDENGYSRIIFAMDASNGWIYVYCGDVLVGHFSAWILNKIPSAEIDVGFFSKNCSNQATANIKYQHGDVMGSVKDISIYKGKYLPEELDKVKTPDPTQYVTFENASGSVLEKREITGEGLTVESFPEIASTKTVCWFEKETGKLVQAPVTYTENTVLVAREFGMNETALIGAQGGPTADGKTSVRFVGGIFDLTGEKVGFDVTATYKDADGNEKSDSYRLDSSTVYSTVRAGDKAYSANELGAMYAFALIIEDIPTDITVTFTVKTFKTSGGIRIYGESGTITLVNGVFADPAVKA